MKKSINKLAILLLLALTWACVDETLDPIKFDEIAKGTYLALRGDAQSNLENTGCTNSFYKNNILGNEVFSFDSDFLSEDQEALTEVQVFAETPTIARVQVATVPGSAWTFPSGSTTKRGNVTVTLATVLSKLGISTAQAANLGQQDIVISCDLLLKDGTKILASAIINGSLFESVIFNPAMNLTYCANDKADFVPVATTKMVGGLPLKGGAKDTLLITYDNPIIAAPTVSVDPATAGTLSAVSKYKTTNNKFYAIYTANGGFTGAVTATVSGATANVNGVVLTQDDKDQVINVDNTAPQITTDIGANLIGVGQFITLKVSFNEKLSTKAADAIKATISGQGLETVTNAAFTVAADGLSASLIYIFKLANPAVPATHGDLTVSFTAGKDQAGNATPVPTGSITVDVNAPPAPTLTLAAGYDLGTQIKWSANETRDNGINPKGDQTGKVYFIAIEAGSPKPTAVSIDIDGNATWTVSTPILQEGTISITNPNGNSANPTYTSFGANGTMDIYAVFLGNTGNKSAITATPQLANVVMN